MSLVRLTLLVALLLGGTALSVVFYVDSRRPVPRDPVVVDQPPSILSSGTIELAQPDSEDEELDPKAT